MSRLMFAVLTLAVAPLAWADGLLYQLPQDGAYVRFSLRIFHEKENDRMETVAMRSVGRSGDARWLEFKLPKEDATETIKVLFPERVLKAGESPMDHVVRAWVKTGDELPVARTRVRDFWLLIFLPGPLADSKKLDDKLIDSPLGKLPCGGVTGRAYVREDDGYEEELAYSIRRHKEAPFGVVSCRIDCQVLRNGKKLDRVTYELKLIEVGKNAESELKDYQ